MYWLVLVCNEYGFLFGLAANCLVWMYRPAVRYGRYKRQEEEALVKAINSQVTLRVATNSRI